MASEPKKPDSTKPRIEVDHDLIRELSDLLAETGLTEIEIERDGMRVRVGRQGNLSVVAAAPGASAPVASPAAVDFGKHPGVVTSPMVGTAYVAAEPGAKPFVDVGSKVKAGETLLVIEAMKTMNQIPAPRAGTVTQIFIEDGRPVEFGEPLMIID
ncbi:MAG: acetyl-CoA carboxylase, biotin carboxyl carrier protein [Rhizobiales bacterium]|nr:acetyl-CoA carboxylase, biotin carboxyl carrier protein [Hyphomicrobiales bacterium]